MAQWALDTTQSEAAVFERYARQRLGLADEDVNRFRRLCLLSADAVVRGRNSTHGDMNPWWTRDAGIGWPRYDEDGDRERNLRQKDESLKQWAEIVELADAIDWQDAETAEFARSSARYGLHLYRIYRTLVYLEAAEGDEAAGESDDRASLLHWIREYERAWAAYEALKDRYPDSISTLYQQDYTRHIRQPAHAAVQDLR